MEYDYNDVNKSEPVVVVVGLLVVVAIIVCGIVSIAINNTVSQEIVKCLSAI